MTADRRREALPIAPPIGATSTFHVRRNHWQLPALRETTPCRVGSPALAQRWSP